MTGSRLTMAEVDRAVELASAAPSVLNSQPWRFRGSPAGIELHADRARQLTRTDPHGREMVISCGAALLNLRLAFVSLCRDPVVHLCPDESDPDYLALVSPGSVRAPTTRERELIAAVPLRHTNRRPFNPEMPDPGILAEVVHAAEEEGASLLLLDEIDAHSVMSVVKDADLQQRADPAVRAEVRRWTTERDPAEGIPAASFGPVPSLPGAAVRDFSLGTPVAGRPSSRFETAPVLAVLATRQDRLSEWLLAGQAMQRAVLTATHHGLAVSYLTQPLEEHELRWLVRPTSSGIGMVQMVLRIGYGPDAPSTPRHSPQQILKRGVWT